MTISFIEESLEVDGLRQEEAEGITMRLLIECDDQRTEALLLICIIITRWLLLVTIMDRLWTYADEEDRSSERSSYSIVRHNCL